MTYSELAITQLQALNERQEKINSVLCGNLDSLVNKTKELLPQIDENIYRNILIEERDSFPLLAGFLSTQEYLKRV